jgi:hypothetical protein
MAWLPGASMTVEPARSDMVRCAGGGIIWSSVAIRYQLGLLRQAPYEWPTRIAGPSNSSSTLVEVSTSLSSDSVWFCTTLTLNPSAVSRSYTSRRPDPSTNPPWTRTMFCTPVMDDLLIFTRSRNGVDWSSATVSGGRGPPRASDDDISRRSCTYPARA